MLLMSKQRVLSMTREPSRPGGKGQTDKARIGHTQGRQVLSSMQDQEHLHWTQAQKATLPIRGWLKFGAPTP